MERCAERLIVLFLLLLSCLTYGLRKRELMKEKQEMERAAIAILKSTGISLIEAAMIAKGKSCRFCYINARRNTLVKAREKELSISEFKEKSPVCIAERYAEDNGFSFDEELHMIFDEVLKIIDNESREE